MWFIVVVEEWKHWDSEFSKVRSIPVYTTDSDSASRSASQGMSCWCVQQVICVGECKPVIMMDENW